MQMRCHFIDDVSNHVVQCWVAGAEFPTPDPMSPTWGQAIVSRAISAWEGWRRTART